MSLAVGSSAPLFSVPDQEGTIHALEQYLGQWVVLYFYPKDDTPGCTKEACGFRDNTEVFSERDAVIFGVSRDTVESHAKFAEKFSLPFPLLSDADGVVSTAYGAWRERTLYGKLGFGIARVTFLIDPAGNIAKIYEGIDVEAHAHQILADIDELSA
jgi:peroxiredoxin Q/BCP